MPLKKRSKVSPEFNLASMIDVIFLLLMFFMLTSKLVSTNALDLRLPSSKNKTNTPPQTVNISLKKSGELYLDKDQITVADLEQSISSEVAKLVASGQKKEEVTVALNVERDVPIQEVVNIMTVANNLKVRMILTTQEDDAK